MAGIVTQNEEFGQRVCILFEFLQGKPVFESYKNLCKKIGDEAIEYKEFDFWFHRFANGKLDLNYDKSLEPETRSFSDIPIEVIANVVDYLNPMDRFIVRKVNRNLRKLVDDRHKIVQFRLDETSVLLELFDQEIEYVKANESCHVICGGNGTIVDGGDYMEIALNDLTSVLKIPDLHLNTLSLAIDSKQLTKKNSKMCFNLLKTSLNSLNHQLHVKTFISASNRWKRFLSILSYLNAKSLNYIALEYPKVDKNEEKRAMSKLFEMDQWKHLNLAVMGTLNAIPVDNISHLTSASFGLTSITAAHVREVQKIFLKSTSMRICYLRSSSLMNTAEIENALGPSVPKDSGIRHYSIPDTNEFLELQILENEIAFRRRC